MTSKQEITAIFNTLLEEVIKFIDPHEIKHKNIYTKLAPNFSVQILLILGLGFFCIAYSSQITNVTIRTSKLVWLVISLMFFFIFLLLRIITNYRSYRSPQEYIERRFNKISFQAENDDWNIVNKLVENSNLNKESLEFVQIKINSLIENIEEKDKISNVLKKYSFCTYFSNNYICFHPKQGLVGAIKI